MSSKNNDNLRYWLGLSLVEGLGPKTFSSLHAYFGSAEAIWNASSAQLSRAGVYENTVDSFLEVRKDKDLDAELEKVRTEGVSLVRITDDSYPSALKNIPSPPFLLYVKGELLPKDDVALAVVGTRKYTNYGQRVVDSLVSDLAHSGLTIVSGLAYGIDALSHREALEAGGRTIAVLGCGLDRVYPSGNKELAERIVSTRKGCWVSEFPLGFPPVAGNFPARNRIISGLSLGVLVVEAPEKSGTQITASCAGEQGRPVYAVPGSIFNFASKGCAQLIRDGAKPVLEAQDILSELKIEEKKQEVEVRKVIPESEEEKELLDCLGSTPVHVDKLVRSSGLETRVVLSTLSAMELRGLVEECGSGKWVKCV